MSSDEDNKDMCKYGEQCYQRNPEHHKRFRHPKRKSEEHINNDNKRNKFEKEASKSPAAKHFPDSSEEGNSSNHTHNEQSNKNNENFVKLPSDVQERIVKVFLVNMPEDFYDFYEFCKSLDKKNPHNALAAVGIWLVGPFDLIDRELKDFTEEEGLRHYRYFFDPPEFQTVLTCNDKNLLHYGYFRDEPKDLPVFVASNEAKRDCLINIVSENLFSAVNIHIEKVKKVADPFKKMKIQKIHQLLIDWSKKNDWDLDVVTKKIKERRSKVVAKTFHNAGIVVPYDKKTQLGYRELKENDKNLKKILKDLCEAESDADRKVYWTRLHPVLTYASIANDEYDFGTSLELGIDLFSYGDPILHKAVLQILPTSYELLGRSEFSIILKAHLQNRTKGSDLNTIVL